MSPGVGELEVSCYPDSTWISVYNGIPRTLKKLRTSKRDYGTKQRFSTIMSLFKMETSHKGKNLLLEGANSFLKEQFLKVSKITFTTLC